MITGRSEPARRPTYRSPEDLTRIEAVPLEDRGLPGSTDEQLMRATYKPELRRLATRSSVEDALAGLEGIDHVSARVDHGLIDVLVRLTDEAAARAADDRLSRFALTPRIHVR